MLSRRADLYVQVWRDRLIVENLRSGSRDEQRIMPAHPRVLLGDFLLAHEALKRALGHVLEPREKANRMLVHAQEALDGGLSEIEARAMRDFAVHSGAQAVYLVREPHALSSDEVRSLLDGSARGRLAALRSE